MVLVAFELLLHRLEGEGHENRDPERDDEAYRPAADLVEPEQEDREAAGDAENPGERAAPQRGPGGQCLRDQVPDIWHRGLASVAACVARVGILRPAGPGGLAQTA